ncbi:MAG TPA: TRAP transporter small permease [Ramlibacter sp.]|uniref:TRAP transporter small permease n=1 Tax=Ramlibacter sp. TaxID=1917967 RepID=UPI002D805588|nr:TRAP transporter small permease [Ramlibacter sp.]HET8748392.1 TRAP transporter small permease [Ramlibacter sp.]
MTQGMQRLLDLVCRGLEFAIAAALAVMVVLVFGNVVMRYGFNSGITVSEEVSRWLFIWGTFLGALVALRDHAHLGMDLVVGKLPPAGRKACLVLSHVLMLAIVAMLAKGGWEQVQINWEVAAPTTGWSMAIVHAASVVFAAIAGLILLVDLGRLFTGQLADDELLMVQESEESAQLREILGSGGRT